MLTQKPNPTPPDTVTAESSREDILAAIQRCCDSAKRIPTKDALSDLNPIHSNTHARMDQLLAWLLEKPAP